MTDQDLNDLGFASLGHRRKILCAIADLAIVAKRGSSLYDPILARPAQAP
jgi:SAM domain (Sterile alpha motif)